MNNLYTENHYASFRDPSGYIFIKNGKISRAINFSYRKHYDNLISSGLYDRLVSENLLIQHYEIENDSPDKQNIYKIIQPTNIEFISYPYEWSMSQLKDAALITLQIQKIALEYGMIIKDATAFNIQFHNSKPIFINTLSFEKYNEGEPWVAYRQFCMHFLTPLLLMKYRDLRMIKLLSLFIDGFPHDLTKNLLPIKSLFKISNFSHIYFHSLSEKPALLNNKKRNISISKNGMFALIENLEKSIRDIKLKIRKSFWRDYYFDNSYSKTEFEKKKEFIEEYIMIINPESVIDLGANTGLFSRIASNKNIYTISADSDPYCVEVNYRDVKQHRGTLREASHLSGN